MYVFAFALSVGVIAVRRYFFFLRFNSQGAPTTSCSVYANNREVYFDDLRPDDVLDVKCWDMNILSRPIPLGHCVVPVQFALEVSEAVLRKATPPTVDEATARIGRLSVGSSGNFEASPPWQSLPRPLECPTSPPYQPYPRTAYSLQNDALLVEQHCSGSSSSHAPHALPYVVGPVEYAQLPLSIDTPNSPSSTATFSQPVACCSFPGNAAVEYGHGDVSQMQMLYYGVPQPSPPPLAALSESSPSAGLSSFSSCGTSTGIGSSEGDLVSDCHSVSNRIRPDVNVGNNLVSLMRMIERAYPLSLQGHIWLAITSPEVPNVSNVVFRNKYKKFVSLKYSEKVTALASNQALKHLKMLEKLNDKVRKKAVEAAKPLTDKLKPLTHLGKAFETWKVDMCGVEETFGSRRQRWNRNHPAAVKIFETVGAREAVKTQHATLYGGTGVASFTTLRLSCMAETGCVFGGEGLLELLKYGKRNNKARMFTYVLKTARLYIAETGADFFLDMNSKHAMHANADEEVVYAGELHLRRRVVEGGGASEYTLVLDNNSGTYAPDKDHLPLLREVFMRNFANLNVEAYDHADPVLQEYTATLRANDLESASSLSISASEADAVARQLNDVVRSDAMVANTSATGAGRDDVDVTSTIAGGGVVRPTSDSATSRDPCLHQYFVT
jgi:hypothetical protein